ncbi:hypothetical protein HPB50_000377 [Hyalomma asiaticum]|uniref:Uncharacterized protein n=1 Tax=Hyalomma asiaticum TaxID=266040 RepID=A0ACB7SGF6_HYAAI|nr:hypothetical protein HPB50_000377 [Hyalomma asiaticum]
MAVAARSEGKRAMGRSPAGTPDLRRRRCACAGRRPGVNDRQAGKKKTTGSVVPGRRAAFSARAKQPGRSSTCCAASFLPSFLIRIVVSQRARVPLETRFAARRRRLVFGAASFQSA